MLYRILRDLGSMNPAKRSDAIRMATGLPWEDLEQFLSFYDRGASEARRNAWMLLLILLVVGFGTVGLFYNELHKYNLLAPVLCAAVAVPVVILFSHFGSRSRAHHALRAVLNQIDDPAFIPASLGILSEKHADTFSFRADIFTAIARLLPQVTVELAADWTPEERNALSHGLRMALPLSAGGRDALSHSPVDVALVILKVLQRIGDQREVELVQLVSTIDPLTINHQKVREASIKCLRSIEKRLRSTQDMAAAEKPGVQAAEPIPTVARLETDVSHLLKPRLRQRTNIPDQTG